MQEIPLGVHIRMPPATRSAVCFFRSHLLSLSVLPLIANTKIREIWTWEGKRGSYLRST
jgi:hypothetical protein